MRQLPPGDPGSTMSYDGVLPTPGGHPLHSDNPTATQGFNAVLKPDPEIIIWHDLAQNGKGLVSYELGPLIGRGPVGQSYRGRRKADGTEVVVKVLTRRFDRHPELKQAVLSDLMAWKAISHPSLAGLLTMGVTNGRNAAIFEHAPGIPLSKYLTRIPSVPPGSALRIIRGIAEALMAGLKRGLHHGDIRDEKVYIRNDTAKLVDPGEFRASSLAAGFGQLGMSFGHPAYLAPEVLVEGRQEPDGGTDVYALGILAYQMITGNLPYTAEGREIFKQHAREPLPPPAEPMPAPVAGLILRMTAKAPSARISGPEELLAMLARVERGESLPALAPAEPPRIALRPPPPPNEDDRIPLPQDAVSLVKFAEEQPTRQVVTNEEEWKVESNMLAEQDEDWGMASEIIKDAPRVGPKEWVPESVDEDSTDPGLTEIIAAQHAKSKNLAPPKEGKKTSSSKLPLLMVVGALLVGAAAFVHLQDDGPPPRRPPRKPVDRPQQPGNDQPSNFKPPPKLSEAAKQREALRAKIAEELEDCEREAMGLVAQEKFKEALDASRGALSEDAAATLNGQRLLSKIEEAARAGSSKKLEGERSRFEQLLREEDFTSAELLVQSVAAWALDEGAVESLKSQLAEKQEELLAPVKALSLANPLKNVQAARTKLRKSVNGQVYLFEGGGMLVSYDKGRALLEDLKVLKGSKKSVKLGAGSGGQVVRVNAAKSPVVLQVGVPLYRLLDANLTISVAQKLSETAHIALLVSGRPGQLDSRGLSRGTVPVELNDQGKLQTLLTMRSPRIEAREQTRLSLAVEGRGSAASITGAIQTPRGRQPLRRPQRLGRRAARLLIYVSGADVRLEGLQVRGLVDPRAVQ